MYVLRISQLVPFEKHINGFRCSANKQKRLFLCVCSSKKLIIFSRCAFCALLLLLCLLLFYLILKVHTDTHRKKEEK